MPLSTVRNLLIEATGRADLLDPEMALGADYLINEGQKILDRLVDSSIEGARYHVDIDAGSILVPIPNVRVIQHVYAYDGEKRTRLEKADLLTFRHFYNQPKINYTASRPKWYVPIASFTPPTLDPSLFEYSWVFDDVPVDTDSGFKSIIVGPPTDIIYTFEVWGKFYTEQLVDDSDESIWTEQYPTQLIQAAIRALEGFYRNSEGLKDLQAALQLDVAEINKDIYEGELSDTSGVMEG